MSYADKLRDPRWQKKRLHVFERDDWRCTKCDDGTKELHVHHTIYFSGEPWDIPIRFLKTLCDSCHKKEHIKKIKKIIYANRRIHKNNNR